MRTVQSLILDVVVLSCSRTNSPPSAASVSAAAPSSCALPEHPVIANHNDENLEGRPLASCSGAPLTGFFRDGRCSTGPEDTGVHVVCSQVTTAFLEFTRARGNDLQTPRGSFAGLKDGDRWCLCAARWAEAEQAGVAPPVVIEATHARASEVLDANTLRSHALRDAAAPAATWK